MTTSKTPAPIVLRSTEPANTTTLPYVSLLPLRIGLDGEAAVSTYFVPRPACSCSSPSSLEATFRGRLVVSTPFKVPKGYRGVVLETSSPMNASLLGLNDATAADDSGQKRKRAKLEEHQEHQPEQSKSRSKPLLTGLRRSPRKKVQRAQPKFSMDSDDDEDEDGLGNVNGEERAALGKENLDPDAPKSNEDTPSSVLVIKDDDEATPDPPHDTHLQPEHHTKNEERGQETNEEVEDSTGSRDIQYLVPKAKFDTIQIWNADYQLATSEDLYGRTLTEWFRLAEKIHSF